MKQQKFMAIGGDSFRQGSSTKIHQRIIQMSDKVNPTVLIIPTASRDDARFVQKATQRFEQLGCRVDVLYLYAEKPSSDQIQAKINAADIVYVGGGNTLRMMNLWRKCGVATYLCQAWQTGTVLCGSSAGSICWFNAGNSDSRKDNNPDADYIKVTALGYIDALHCPHYDSEAARKDSFKKMLQKYAGVGIALDDFAAIEIIGDVYTIITSSDTAQAYKVYWKDGIFYEQVLEQQGYQPLHNVLSK